MTPRLELLSLHLPKSAGTAFTRALEVWYDGDSLHLDYDHGQTPLPEQARAVHGHLMYDAYSADRVITWMRDPAARVMSHYFYWRTTPPSVDNPDHVLVREQELSLLEAAELPRMRNLASHYLGGRGLDALAFVGLAERIPIELQRLALLLGKPHQDIPRQNVTRSTEYAAFKASVTPEVTAQLRMLNSEDCSLYAEAQARSTEFWKRPAA